MAEFRSIRRYYLLKARFNDGRHDVEFGAIALAFYGKQALEPGTPLPLTLAPRLLDELWRAHYRAIEDLDGADVEELAAQGIARSDATAIFEALGLGA